MKIPYDKQYMKIVFHIFLTCITVYLGYVFIHDFNKILSAIGKALSAVMSALSPAIIGFVIAYLFDPLVDFFQERYEQFQRHRGAKEQKYPRKRTFGTAAVFLSIIALLALLSFLGVKGINSAVNSSDNIPSETENISKSFTYALEKVKHAAENFGIWQMIAPIVTKITANVSSFFIKFSTSATKLLIDIGAAAINIFIGFIISFYLLNEKEPILEKTRELSKILLRKKSKKISNFLSDVDAVFSGYIRGQITDAMIISVLMTITLAALKVPFAPIIGAISGFSNLIPYFGAIIGLLLAVIVTLLEGDMTKVLLVTVAILIIQQIDSILISPRVVGENVKLHPVIVLIVILAAGKLSGISGMIFAVPLIATIKLFLTRYIDRRRKNLNEDTKLIEFVEISPD